MLYSLELRETVDQYQNIHCFLLTASSLEDAQKKAKRYARAFFPDPYAEMLDGAWYFFDWDVSITIECVEETTEEQWKEEAFKRAMVTDKCIKRAETDLEGEIENERIAADPSHLSHCTD